MSVKKLVFVHFKLLNMVDRCYNRTDHTHSVGYHACAHATPLHMLDLNVGKICQIIKCVQLSSEWSVSMLAIRRYNSYRAKSAWGMCSRELFVEYVQIVILISSRANSRLP